MFSFLRRAIPVAASIFGGPVGGAIAGGVMGAIGARREAKGMEQAGAAAGQTALGGFNYLSGSPVGQSYLPAGGAAMDQQAALLGLGGDQAGADAAYQNYLSSTGFQGQLQAGQQAITSNRAARGLLGSGSTAKALQEHGQQLGRQSFNNYLGQLQGVSGQGLQAGGMLGQSAAQGYSDAGRYQYGAGMGAAGARRGGWDQLMGGLGEGLDAWQAGKRAAGRRDSLSARNAAQELHI